jgi:hypothetical protein
MKRERQTAGALFYLKCQIKPVGWRPSAAEARDDAPHEAARRALAIAIGDVAGHLGREVIVPSSVIGTAFLDIVRASLVDELARQHSVRCYQIPFSLDYDWESQTIRVIDCSPSW